MAKKIQLHIAEPCHENWDKMTPVEQGKFCQSCQKQVVDFTGMSDRQLAQFFKKPLEGSVCGRFMNDQLDRDIDIPKKRLPFIRYFFTVALPALFFSKANGQRTMGKPMAQPLRDTVVQPVEHPPVLRLGMVAPDRVIPQPQEPVKVKTITLVVNDAVTGRTLQGVVVEPLNDNGYRVFFTGSDGLVDFVPGNGSTFRGVKLTMKGYEDKTVGYGEFKCSRDGRVYLTLQPIRKEIKKDPPKQDIPTPPTDIIMGAVAFAPDERPIVRNEIELVVVNQNGDPVSFASIVKGPGDGAAASENGHFTITKKWLNKKNTLSISAVGYHQQKITISEQSWEDGTIKITMEPEIMLEPVVLNSYSEYYSGRTVGMLMVKTEKLNSRKSPEIITAPAEKNTLQVYPNPAQPGQSIHIALEGAAEGYYDMICLDMNGRTVQQKNIWLDKTAGLFEWQVPAMPRGVYELVLLNKANGKKLQGKLVVQ